MLLERVLRFFIVLITAIIGGTLFELLVPTANDYLSAPLWQTELGVFGLSLAGLVCILVGTVRRHRRLSARPVLHDPSPAVFRLGRGAAWQDADP